MELCPTEGGILGSDLMPAGVKSEVGGDDEFAADEVDHVPLTERMRMLLTARTCNSFSGVQTTKRALGSNVGTVSKQEARSLEVPSLLLHQGSSSYLSVNLSQCKPSSISHSALETREALDRRFGVNGGDLFFPCKDGCIRRQELGENRHWRMASA